jgi:GntR family transcriptional regulator, rspAB operon transcriptional repressor
MSLSDPSSRQRAYEAIKEAILSNQFPQGESLAEQMLADLYQVSRTPVREALQRLAKDGLVEMIPRHGAFVARISLEDAVEIFHMREALEGMAARLAAPFMPDSVILQLDSTFEAAAALDAPDRLQLMSEAGVSLHDAILLAARSDRMRQAVTQLLDQITRLRQLAVTAPGRRELSLDQHRRILDALRVHDPNEAERQMRQHLASTLETITGLIVVGGLSHYPRH